MSTSKSLGIDYNPTVTPTRIEDPFEKKNRALSKKGKVRLYPSQWVERFVRIKNADTGTVDPMDFKERKYLLRPYNTSSRKVLLMTSRQTEKSTTLANKLLSLVGMRSLYSSLFVTPSAMQTKVFSTARLDGTVDVSPLIKALKHTSLTYNLLEKTFLNKSLIYLRYAFLSADRIRGLSVNAVFLDEIQDMLQELLPVIEETSSHHKDTVQYMSGTPKSLENTIEVMWSRDSTQSEWVIPCERHGTGPGTWHWNILGIKNIGKTGPICDKCGGPLNPEHPHAQWVEMNPGAEIEGLRICRLMVPWFFKDPAKWKDILHTLERYPTAQFMNEVLALSHDSGVKPLTRMDIIQCCDASVLIDEEATAKLGQVYDLYGGVDWGDGTSGSSYTVLFVGGYTRTDHRFQIVYAKRFDGLLADPTLQMKELKRLITKFRLKYVGTDFGMGLFPNSELISTFGPKKIHPFQYTGRQPMKVAYKKALHRYLVFRSPVLTDFFMAIRKGKVAFPSWEQFKDPFASDMLTITAEYSETLKMMQYLKTPGRPDDSFHAYFYCFMVSMLDQARPDILTPMQSNTEEGRAAQEEAEALRDIMDRSLLAEDIDY